MQFDSKLPLNAGFKVGYVTVIVQGQIGLADELATHLLIHLDHRRLPVSYYLSLMVGPCTMCHFE